MASSTLAIYVNRNGYDNLWSKHTGLTGTASESFSFPEGTWSVEQATIILFGGGYTLRKNMWHANTSTGSATVFSIDQGGALYHVDGSATTIGVLPIGGSTYWLDTGDDYYRAMSFGADPLYYESGDALHFDGAYLDAGTDGTCEIELVARRLQ